MGSGNGPLGWKLRTVKCSGQWKISFNPMTAFSCDFNRSMQHFAKDETPLTDKIVAERIGKSLTTLWRWKKNGKIGTVLVGGEKRVRECDLDDYLKRNGECGGE